MSLQKSIPSHHQIVLRQKTEDNINSYHKHVSQDKKLEFISRWEAKSQKRVTGTHITMEMDQIEAVYNDVLMERKRRLAELFAKERDQYEAELVASSETETQRRDRIATEALKLRNEREELRKQTAMELQQRSFVASCVPLREAASKLMLLKCVSERATQLEELKHRKQGAREEEEFFEALENKTRSEAEFKQMQEISNRRSKTAQMQRDLSTQRTANETMRSRAQEVKRMEDEAFSEYLRQVQQEEQDKEQQRRQTQRELAAKNKASNQQFQREKDSLMEKKKEEDKKELQVLLDQIREDERLEAERKLQAKSDAKARRQEQELALRKFADNQSQLDELWKAESDKQWDKLEARRQREADERDSMLKDVHQGRLDQIRSKRAAKLAAKDDKIVQREVFQQTIAEENKKEAERSLAAKSSALRNQMQLRQQIEENQRKQDFEKARKLEEMAAGYAAEQEFSERMKKELEMLEASKPPEFSTVKSLVGTRRIM